MKNATVAIANAGRDRSRPAATETDAIWQGSFYEEERRKLLKTWFDTANLITNYYSNAEMREIISDTLLALSEQRLKSKQGLEVFEDHLPKLAILRRGLHEPAAIPSQVV
jgi:hypothetical protein